MTTLPQPTGPCHPDSIEWNDYLAACERSDGHDCPPPDDDFDARLCLRCGQPLEPSDVYLCPTCLALETATERAA